MLMKSQRQRSANKENYEALYFDQVRMNKQLLDQIKTLKATKADDD